MPPSWHPVPACTPRLYCRRAVLRCRNEGAAAIPDFRPRLANRCSQKVKSGAIRASILDFKPRLGNRCSQKAKPGQSLQSKGRSIVPRPGNAGWAGTSDGVAARGFVNGEGPAAQRWEGKHRRCAPVRSPCPQAESAAETAQTPQADSAAGALSTRHNKRVPTHR